MILHLCDGIADFLYGLADLRDLRHGLCLIRGVLLLFLLCRPDQPCDLFQNRLDFLMHRGHILLQIRNLRGGTLLQLGDFAGNIGSVLGKFLLGSLHFCQGFLPLCELLIHGFQFLLIFRNAVVKLFQIIRSGFHLRLHLILHALLHFSQSQLRIRLHAAAEKSHSCKQYDDGDGRQRDSGRQQLSAFRRQLLFSFRISAEELFSIG